MPTETALDRKIATAVHTACSEIPNADPDDIADCVCGIIGLDLFLMNEATIVALIGKYV